MNRNVFFAVSLFCLLAFIFMEPAFAGPGGKIAKALFETFWGKIFLGIITIVLLPIIIYVIIREELAERRARKDLRYMATYHNQFEWLVIQRRVKDCFYRVHSGWEKEDLSGVSNWMTSWYWQNQQLVFLENWKSQGLVNICDVKKITKIKPLLFVHNNYGKEHEESMVVISIEAKMKDYLMVRETGKIVEGSKKYKKVETIWSFQMEDRKWKVSDIEEDCMSLAYIKIMKELPMIENTITSKD